MSNALLRQAVHRAQREQLRRMADGLVAPRRRRPVEEFGLRTGFICCLVSVLVFVALIGGIWSAFS